MTSKIKIHCRHDGTKPAADFQLHPDNWNGHPPRQLALYAKIIRATGWRRPVVVSKRSGYVTKGNGAVQAARAHQLGPVPFEIQPYKTEAEELADLTADNKLAESAQANPKKLAALLDKLADAGTDTELAGILTAIENEAAAATVLPEQFQILLDCGNEAEQTKLLKRFEKEGLKCRPLIS